MDDGQRRYYSVTVKVPLVQRRRVRGRRRVISKKGKGHKAQKGPEISKEEWEPTPEERDLQRAWSAFRLALIGILPAGTQAKGIRISVQDPTSMQTAISIEALRAWLLNSWYSCGQEWTVQQVKAYAEFCRARSLRDKRAVAPRAFPVRRFEQGQIRSALLDPINGRVALAQMARVARAMPTGTQAQVIRAQQKHMSVLSTPSDLESDHELIVELRAWARAWSGAQARNLKETITVSFSKSAAEAVSRAQGGQRRDLWLNARPDFEAIRAALFEDDAAFGITSEDDYIGTYCEEDDLQIVTDAAIRAASNARRLPVARAAAIPELGGKIRVVTACEAVEVVAGDAARKAVWPLLENEPRIDLSGRRTIDDTAQRFVDEVARSVVGARSTEFYSADLTAATDLMPHTLIYALWDGVMEGLGVSPDDPLFKSGRRLLGPVRVSYPDLQEDPEVGPPVITSRRGCMMGLPLSWFVLNVYNLALADLAVCRTIGTHTRVGIAPVVVRGDDLAGALRKEEADAYERMVLGTEGKPNVGKSFRSQDAFILAERTFLCELAMPDKCPSPRAPRGTASADPTISDRAPLAARIPSIRRALGDVFETVQPRVTSLKMLTDIPIRHLLPEGPDPNAPPPHVSIPVRCAAVLAEFEETPRYKCFCESVLSVHSGLVTRFRQAGVPLFLPRECGGAGFPHPKGFGASVASAGPVFHRRATAEVTIHGDGARRKARLHVDLWAPPRALGARERARTQLLAEESRVLGTGGMGRLVPSYLEDEITRRGASALLWEEVMLPAARREFARRPQYPSLYRIAANLKRLALQTSKIPSVARIPDRFLLGRNMTRERFLARRHECQSVATVYVPLRGREREVRVLNEPNQPPERPSERRQLRRSTGFAPRSLYLSFPPDEGHSSAINPIRAEAEERVAWSVPVSTVRGGLTLGDVAVFVPERKRGRRTTHRNR
nr:MAG: RNA-dependent RNA polymerase [Sanya scirpophaga incertulas narnavirus 1]